jgi:hypothetical protein
MSQQTNFNDPRFADSRRLNEDRRLAEGRGNGALIAFIVVVVLLAAGYFIARAQWSPATDATSSAIPAPTSSVPAPATTAPMDVTPTAPASPNSMAPAEPPAANPPAATTAPTDTTPATPEPNTIQ